MNVSIDQQLPVKIVMVTYNQERYIVQAIESVLRQNTDFNYRLVIGDDCSTDSTADICEEYAKSYPEKISLIKTYRNMGLLANYKQVMDAFPAQYIAILEGDDYWIDDNKLQTQYNLLQEKPEIGLVHTNCDLLFESGKIQIGSHQRHARSIKNGIVFDQLLTENYIRPVTVMFRSELYTKYVEIDEYIKLGFKTLDYPMWLDIAPNSRFYYLNYSTAVYRIHGISISNSNLYEKQAEFFKSIYEIKNYAMEKYNPQHIHRKSIINSCLVDQIVIDMEFRKYDKVFESAKSIEILDLKSRIICIVSKNKILMDLLVYYLNYRKKL